MMTLPERFNEFAEARRNGFLKVMELKESGANICGSFCQYAPAEVIYAAGLYKVGLCGKSSEPIATAETHLPANLCPLIKSSYGHALEQSCPYSYFSDIVVGETTCDGKKKMYEMLGKLKPMHVIHLPNVPDRERSLDAWVMEIRHFKEVLEERFEVEITDEKLREAIKWGNKERIQAARIYELGRYDPPAITGVNMRNIMDGEQYMFNRYEKYEKLKQILDDCEENWKNGKGPYKPDEHPPRILISGAGLGGVAKKSIDVVEELGGAIVCYEGCSGIVSRRRLIDESEDRDPIVCIAEKYLEVPCAVMSPNSKRMTQVAATIAEWNVEGVVNITLHSCHPFGIESCNIAKVCDECDTPYLHIETDFSSGDLGQIRTRIEAFLEIIKSRR
ncbi:MAG: double-cubane-cluster-containing anaerobic reductase [Lutispora sp.]|nr:double-cubane-cluster-containing anaerobic reductase [Lutispora sp.]